MSTHEAARNSSIKGREIAIFASDGVNEEHLFHTKNELEKKGAIAKILSPKQHIKGNKGTTIKVDHSFLSNMSMIFDALYIPGGAESIASLIKEKNALEFICETYKASKAIATDGEGVDLLRASCMKDWLSPSIYNNLMEQGIVIHVNKEPASRNFIRAIEKYRFWDRLQLSNTGDNERENGT